MPRYVRPRVSGARVFLTVCLAERGSNLLTREVARLREAVRVTKAERPFAVDAWVVMPDHMHCVWTLPVGDRDFSGRVGAIKARFSMGLDAGRRWASHEARREKAIWQRRFWERHIRDEKEFAACIRYCWINPVRHGFVGRPVDWRYSSLHREIELGRVEPEWSGAVPSGDFGE
ncbi:REP-associated tyrosine transposase [Aestuariibius sp. 2305UL40-4]|uniref:REP-associated tyrosine transposase n=1 Tax=Aestuariibius violaceus TaxID=3234132 RepID=UPI00398E67C3